MTNFPNIMKSGSRPPATQEGLMPNLNRRALLASGAMGAAAAAVTAVPALALSPTLGNPEERIKHHTAAIKAAMREYYGADIEVLVYSGETGGRPYILVVAKTI
jgi:hypothetical protein